MVDNKNSVEKYVKELIKLYQYKSGQEIYKVDINVINTAFFDCAQLNTKYKIQRNYKKCNEKYECIL